MQTPAVASFAVQLIREPVPGIDRDMVWDNSVRKIKKVSCAFIMFCCILVASRLRSGRGVRGAE